MALDMTLTATLTISHSRCPLPAARCPLPAARCPLPATLPPFELIDYSDLVGALDYFLVYCRITSRPTLNRVLL